MARGPERSSKETTPVSVQELANQYLLSDVFNGLSHNSKLAYTRDVRHFSAFCQNLGVGIESLNPDLIRKWIDDQKQAQYATATINRRVSVVKGFIQLIDDKRFLESDLCYYLRHQLVKRPQHEILTQDDVDRMLADARSRENPRDLVLMHLFLQTGQTPEAIRKLKVGDVAENENRRIVVNFEYAKKDSEEFELDEEGSQVIEKYLDKRRRKKGDGAPHDLPLIPSRPKGLRFALTRQAIWLALSRYQVKGGPSFTPRSLKFFYEHSKKSKKLGAI